MSGEDLDSTSECYHWGWIAAPSFLAVFLLLILLVVLVVILVYYSKWRELLARGRQAEENFRRSYAESIVASCQKATFQSTFPLPPFSGEDFSLPHCQALLQTSFNVTLSNCVNILPITPPPGFEVALRLTGKDPLALSGASGPSEKMIAYFFHSPASRLSCVAFTGTWFLSEWKTDLDFPQVPPPS